MSNPKDSYQPPKDKFWRAVIYFGIVLCFVMTYFQYVRAVGGNQRSWTYVFEWPILGAIGIWMIVKVRNEMRNPTVFSQQPDDPQDKERSEEHTSELQSH